MKGVGPKFAAVFESKGLASVRDALFYFPRDYQDRSQQKKISELVPGERVTVRGQIVGHSYISGRRLRRPILEARLSDDSGKILSLKWFHYPKGYLEPKLKERPHVLVYGEPTVYGSIVQMVHPEIDWESGTNSRAEGIIPIYSETEGLNQRTIRRVVQQSAEIGLPLLEEDLPEELCQQQSLLPIRDAIRFLHNPPANADVDALKNFRTPAQRRLVFEEFFKFQLLLGMRRVEQRKELTDVFPAAPALLSRFEKKIPFQLTGDQRAAIEKIWEDLAQPKPMTRLLQGDVGCGKTLVGFCASLPVIAAKGQVALLAPTEILAQQHFQNAKKVLGEFCEIGFLVGSTKAKERAETLSQLESGKIQFIVGTHALIEDAVQFRALNLALIDEQHRFGVDQRARLRAKGKHPHMLSMTATPIPRTLALTAYGDLDVTIVREMPKGRPEIKTKAVSESQRDHMYSTIVEELKKGHQAYVIYPLIEESEKMDLANAVAGAEELANGPLHGFRIGLLHGRLTPAEKDQVMQEFKRNEIHVLVSTTVVEVGVDVPNATVLVIENAERFGLSQLHQLRGRVGRGTATSFCFLSNRGMSPIALQRLQAMEKTRDGFKLAELDLEIRGPGDFLGTRQSGDLTFLFGSLLRDQTILVEARKAAFETLMLDPKLEMPKHSRLRTYLKTRGAVQKQRLGSA